MKAFRSIPKLIWQKKIKILLSMLMVTSALLLLNGAIQMRRNTAVTAANTQATKDNTQATKNNTSAILNLVTDFKNNSATADTNAKRNLEIIICMLQVPQSQRTTQVEEQCRKAADIEVASRSASDTTNATPKTKQPSSSSQNNPTSNNNGGQNNPPPDQEDPPQAPPPLLDCKVDIFVFHIGCPKVNRR